jgi:hypothetical protein
MAEVDRLLGAYRRGPGDQLVGEWPIRGLDTPALQQLFGEVGEMYDSFPVLREHIATIERATGQSST